jgi:hypothetical protein
MAKRVKHGNGKQHGNNQESHSEAIRGASDQVMQSKSGNNLLDLETGGAKIAHATEVIDLTHSSPAPEDTLEMESQQYLSSVEYGSGDEYEVSKSLHH